MTQDNELAESSAAGPRGGTVAGGQAPSAERQPSLVKGYNGAALFLLTLVYVFNFLDRQILNILAESIKTELKFTDTQLGLVTGFAFALFYSLLGLPIARYAERGDRPILIAAALSVWSLFTIACGFATTFTHMLLARFGVGIGEAGGVPPSHSLITEFTPKNRRALALAIFSTGLPLGSFVGFAFGGIAGDVFGWRTTFVLAGAPGLLIAIFCLLILREPRRQAKPAPRKVGDPSLVSTLKGFLAKRTFVWVAAGGALQGVVIYGLSAFLAPFFLRAHGPELASIAASFGLKPTGFLGLAFGLTLGLAGAVGTFTGGWLSDRLSGTSLKGYVTVPAVAAFIAIPLYYWVFMTPSVALALPALAIGSALLNSYFGPMHATCQGLVGPTERATVSAFTLVIVNLVGLGIGPPLAGLLSDYGHMSLAMTSADALRLSLMIVSTILLLSGACFWRARRCIDADTVS